MSRLGNLERSLNVYLAYQLTDDVYNDFTLLFPFETFGDTLPSQWIEVNYIPLSTEMPVGRVHLGWGSSRQLLVNCNVFVQKQDTIGQSGLLHQYSMPETVDIVRDVLGPRAIIPIRDYATLSEPIVAYFGWRGVQARRMPMDVRQGLEQWNVSCTLAYAEEHEA